MLWGNYIPLLCSQAASSHWLLALPLSALESQHYSLVLGTGRSRVDIDLGLLSSWLGLLLPLDCIRKTRLLVELGPRHPFLKVTHLSMYGATLGAEHDILKSVCVWWGAGALDMACGPAGQQSTVLSWDRPYGIPL